MASFDLRGASVALLTGRDLSAAQAGILQRKLQARGAGVTIVPVPAGRRKKKKQRAATARNLLARKEIEQTLKGEIEALQAELQKSQATLQRDFARWHEAALAEARGARAPARAVGAGAGNHKRGAAAHGHHHACRDRTNGDDGTRAVELY